MYRDHTTGVVLPAYNEADHIGSVIGSMPQYVDRIYVVDDYSSDSTWDKILEAAREDRAEQLVEEADSDERESPPAAADGGAFRTDGGGLLAERADVRDPVGRVVPIAHRENMGAGGAIKTGYLTALYDEMDITVTMDGDGQMDPKYMPQLLDPLVEDEADYAKGNRLLYKEYREDMPKFRFLGNSILTVLTKIASGYWKTMDPQNGYTAISHYALENVGVETMYEYYGYCNDLLVKLNAKGMRVADVAMPAIYGTEESSITYREYVPKVSLMLLRDFSWRLKVKYFILDFHPLALFYLFGAGAGVLGLAGGIWSLYANFALGDQLFVRAFASLLMFMMGCMFVMFAMVFDMQANENREVQVRR